MKAWTIGHSTRPIEDFLALLAEHGIQALADVRRFPASRKHPHFNAHNLEASLAGAGIEYVPMTGLGGRRPTRPDSRNTAWRNASFRGYADYMETEGFAFSFSLLLEFIEKRRTAIMCAEALWWRCHRSLISDALKVTGVEVCHILGPGDSTEHPYTSAANVADGRLSYAEPSLF